MKFILCQEDNVYHIETADNVVDALKQYVAYHYGMDNTPFDILCDSGKMALPELVKYANQFLLPAYAEVLAIHALGENYLTATTIPSDVDFLSEEAIRVLPWRTYLEIPTRAYTCLDHCGPNPYTPNFHGNLEKKLETIGDVADLTKKEIKRIRNAGPRTYRDIAQALRKLKITHTEWYKFEKTSPSPVT